VTFGSALEALCANVGRAVLTTLGIVIGVAAVITIVGLGEGSSAQVSQRVARMGTNVIDIRPGSTASSGIKGGAGTLASLQVVDADAIRAGVDGGVAVSATITGNDQVIAGNQNWQTRVQVVEPQFLDIRNWRVAEGAFFSDEDVAAARSVAVLGHTVAQNLHTRGDTVGKVLLQLVVA